MISKMFLLIGFSTSLCLLHQPLNFFFGVSFSNSRFVLKSKWRLKGFVFLQNKYLQLHVKDISDSFHVSIIWFKTVKSTYLEKMNQNYYLWKQNKNIVRWIVAIELITVNTFLTMVGLTSNNWCLSVSVSLLSLRCRCWLSDAMSQSDKITDSFTKIWINTDRTNRVHAKLILKRMTGIFLLLVQLL